MLTISSDEAQTHFQVYLDAVGRGEEVLIVQNHLPVARLVSVTSELPRPRPKAGEILGPPFSFPDEAFAPLTADEINQWQGA